MSLEDELRALPEAVRALLAQHQFDDAHLLQLAERLSQSEDEAALANRVTGTVAEPAADDVAALPEPGSPEHEELAALGRAALEAGKVAMIVLAGGMATRMGGVVKALVDAIPGHSFLDLQLAARHAAPVPYPLWLMTSHATHDTLEGALNYLTGGRHKVAGEVATFRQGLSVRLTPDRHVFRDDRGAPGLHAPGHGDLPDALKASGLIQRFVEGGGKLVTIANIDNLGAILEPSVVGFHLSHGKPVSCEVVAKVGSDRGGIPVRWNDRPVVLEELRLPESFPGERVRVFNTNTFHVNARALLELDLDWTYFTVFKTVDERRVVQFERFVGEITSALDTRFLKVPRSGPHSRFLPVKSNEELAARRDEIVQLARRRGWLS